MSIPKINLAEFRKGIAAVVTVIGEALTLGLLHGTAQQWATIIVGVAGAAGVIGVPNAKKAAQKA